MSQVSSSFSIDLEKLKILDNSDPRTAAEHELIRSKSITSDLRLFMSLRDSPLLKTVLFEPKKKIISSGKLVEVGYVIISGSLVGVEGEQIYRFGPGSVLGLAEGMINQPSKISIITTTSVQARLIPFAKIDAIMSVLPKEMTAILKTIVNRTLTLS